MLFSRSLEGSRVSRRGLKYFCRFFPLSRPLGLPAFSLPSITLDLPALLRFGMFAVTWLRGGEPRTLSARASSCLTSPDALIPFFFIESLPPRAHVRLFPKRGFSFAFLGCCSKPSRRSVRCRYKLSPDFPPLSALPCLLFSSLALRSMDVVSDPVTWLFPFRFLHAFPPLAPLLCFSTVSFVLPTRHDRVSRDTFPFFSGPLLSLISFSLFLSPRSPAHGDVLTPPLFCYFHFLMVATAIWELKYPFPFFLRAPSSQASPYLYFAPTRSVFLDASRTVLEAFFEVRPSPVFVSVPPSFLPVLISSFDRVDSLFAGCLSLTRRQAPRRFLSSFFSFEA